MNEGKRLREWNRWAADAGFLPAETTGGNHYRWRHRTNPELMVIGSLSPSSRASFHLLRRQFQKAAQAEQERVRGQRDQQQQCEGQRGDEAGAQGVAAGGVRRRHHSPVRHS